MTDDEVNKVIAEYMGVIVCKYQGFDGLKREDQSYVSKLYTVSLDALVPVWEKMNKDIRFWGGLMIYSCIVQNAKQSFDIESNNQDELHLETSSENKDTLQQAAAHATAKAIQELGNQT